MVDFQEESKANSWRSKIEELPPRSIESIPSSVQPPKPDLKPLPFNLKYSFLGENETFPVIISSKLNVHQEDKLLQTLKMHKNALGWTIADIKGISPLICTHKIYLEENAKPSREMQRRLNPNMKEVVKNEIIKLLDNGIIYPISDSKWVSPTQVVPKKSGVTVITNEKNELIPTRTITGWRMCIDYRKLNSMTRKDHFSFFGDSFDDCLTNLEKVLSRCEEKNLVLNWEKCHFMVTNGIVLGHIVSSKGIEVVKSKIELIANLSTPKSVKDVRSFLGHAGFYRRFIKDFSVISKPLSNLLTKDNNFEWTEHCEEAFVKLKNLLTYAPVIQPLIGHYLLK